MDQTYWKSEYWSRRSQTALTRRRLLGSTAVAGAGLASLGLIGCGDDETNSSPTLAATTGASTEPSAAAGKPGGTFSWGYVGAASNSSADNFSATGGGVITYLTSDLAVRLNGTASEITGELFESWETVDNLTYVVHVRPNVKTHDVPLTKGRVFDAQDVVQNLIHLSGINDPANAALYIWRNNVAGLASAQAVDDHTVRVVFNAPTAFPHGLSTVRLGFMARENWDDPATLKDGTKYSATGPWICDKFVKDQQVTFRPNRSYWRNTPNYLDQYVIRPAGDRVSQVADFLQGNTQYLENPTAVEVQTVSKTLKGAQLHSWPGATATAWAFNLKRPPFDDPRVRKALHLATRYVDNLTQYWGKDNYTLAGVLNNAHSVAYSAADILQRPGWRIDKSADLQTANQLLAAAGFPNGQGLTVNYMMADTNPLMVSYGGDFAIRHMDNWRVAFPKITLTPRSIGDRATLEAEYPKGNWDVTHNIILSPYPAATNLISSHGTKGAENITGYSNPALDKLLADASNPATSASQAATILKQAQDILLEDVPQVIEHRAHQSAFYAPNVRGFPTIPGGEKPLAGSFESWITATRHSAYHWLA